MTITEAHLTKLGHPLTYGDGRDMRWQPINWSVVDLDNLFERFWSGIPVTVELEPGDGTYYSLMMLYCRGSWADCLSRWGIPPKAKANYIFVARLESQQMAAEWILVDNPTIFVDSLARGNEWSAQFLSWWLSQFRLRRDEWLNRDLRAPEVAHDPS